MAAAAQTSTPHTDPNPPLDPLTPHITLTQETAQPLATTTIRAKSSSPRKDIADNSNRSPKSTKDRLAYSVSPVSLTGAAAMAELKRQKLDQNQGDQASRQTSPNPAVEAMQSLMGNGGISRPSDAPAPNKLSEPLRQVAEKIQVPEVLTADSTQPSPTSITSFVTNDSAAAGSAFTATASNVSAVGQNFVAEPDQIPQETYPTSNNDNNLQPEQDADGNKAYSYPGPPPSEHTEPGGPSRGMSLPGYGQSSPKSPASNKRHKCPYCATDFTRHHNLKSHLLTHSQEKPYVCQTCNARFRRLHDLKRHTKLHTGERPHTCDKCGRRFARGDALARHNKGPGGCAGRRSSFGGDDEYGVDGQGGEAMDGVEYAGEEEEGLHQPRRVSEPSRKRAHLETAHDSNREVYRQHPSTYPPAQHSRGSVSSGTMAPPQVIHPGSSSTTSPRDVSGHPSPALSNVYYPPAQGQVFTQQSPMTESPKPLSPGQTSDQHRLSVPDTSNHSLGRNRSPSLTAQFQQAHFGRGGSRNTPPFVQPPQQQQQQPPGPQLPALPGLSPSQPPQPNQPSPASIRPAMQPSAVPSGPGPSLLHHGQVPPTSTHNSAAGGSAQNSLSSHGHSSSGSLRDAFGHDQADIWAYVRSLEQRFGRMQDEYELRISRLQEEVITLRGQVSSTVAAAAGAYASESGTAQAQASRF